MRTSVRLTVLATTLAIAAGLHAEPIGRVHRVQGDATLVRDGVTQPATSGAALLRADRLRTGTPGAIGIVLNDDTTISLGSGSELDLEEHVFEPAQGRFAQVVRMLKGTLSYISGQIARLSPESVRLQTPDAAIAVRGTKLLVEVSQ